MESKPDLKTVELTIDGKPAAAFEGEKLIAVAERNGVAIPHFCYHPHLSVAGSCRMCLVKIEGVPKLMPACNVSVAANMKIETTSAEVRNARRNVLQFLMLNHPIDCGICDKAGECRLQNYQFDYGAPRSTSDEPKHHKRKLYALSSRVQLDSERCILCSRCVRFTREVSKTHMLGIVERGGKAYVDRLHPENGEDPYSDNVIGLCPTGALLSREFLYASRVWFLEPVPSVCTGCARGCSLRLWRRKQEWRARTLDPAANDRIYRVTAGEHPDIHGPWICNKGFDQHKLQARPRVLCPTVNDADASLEDALARARTLLSQARRPAAFVSAQASNEELDAFAAALGGRLTVYVREDVKPAPGEVIEDDILIRADKNPNSFGVRRRFGDAQWDGAEHDVALVWGEWLDLNPLAGARVIHLAAYTCTEPAEVRIPISTTFERSGTFSNFEGKLNRFEPVFEKPASVAHAADVFARLSP